MRNLLGSILEIVGAVSVVLFLALIWMDTETQTLEEVCEAATIEWAGYRSCWKDEACGLSDDEVLKMYKLGKRVNMYCSMEITANILRERSLVQKQVEAKPDRATKDDII